MNKLILMIPLLCLLVGCKENEHDVLEVWNKSNLIFDDVRIDIKSGYFYDSHKKFTVDENMIGVTVYFSIDETWDSEVQEDESEEAK